MAGAGGEEVGRISIRVVPDTDRFRSDLERDVNKAEKGVRGQVQVGLTLAKSEIAKIKQAISDIEAKVNVGANTAGVRQQIQAQTRGITAEIDVDVKKSTFKKISDKLSNLGPSFGSGVNPAGYAVGAVAILAAAAPLVGIITTALLALPGVVALIATPIAALTLGMDGLKKAAESVKAPFEDLKTTLSDRVQEQFTPVFEKLQGIFPALKASLPSVTQGLADLFQGVTDSVTNPENLTKIQDTISNIGTALSNARPGIENFTDGILSLVNKLSEKFPGITDWFNGAGESFDKWVSKIIGDGTLDTAFEGLGSSLKSIADTLGTLAGQGLEFMKDPEQAQKFATALSRVGDALTKIVNFSDKLYEIDASFRNLMSGIGDSKLGDLFTVQSGGLTDLNFGTYWEDLKSEASTAAEWIKGVFSDIGGFFSAQGSVIAQAWSQNWEGIKSAASSAWNGVVSVVQGAVSSISGVVSGIGSSIAGVWNGIVGAAQNAWSQVVAAVQNALGQAVAAVVTGAGQIVAEVAALGGKVVAAAGNLGSALVGAGRALMDGLLSGIKAGLQAVLDFAGGIAAKIAAVKGPLPKDRLELIPAGEALMHGLDKGLQNGFTSVLDRASGMGDQLAEAFGPGKAAEESMRDWEKQIAGMGKGFVESNARQFMADLGIGGGAITAALEQGVALGEQFIFQVSSMDEAVAGQQSIQNKKALQFNRR